MYFVFELLSNFNFLPEARWHTKDGTYECHPPFDCFLADADLINGLIVGTWNGTVEWVHTFIQKDGALW